MIIRFDIFIFFAFQLSSFTSERRHNRYQRVSNEKKKDSLVLPFV